MIWAYSKLNINNWYIPKNMFLPRQNIVCENMPKIHALIGCNTKFYFY